MQSFVAVIVAFVREHEAWALPIVFLVAFGESFAFLSVLWPGTAILVGITGLLAYSGIKQSIVMPMIIAATLGGSVGYAVSYWIGRYFQDSIPGIWPFTRYPDMIPRGERFFNEYGAWGVFLGHFFGPVRAVIPVVAGMFKMPQVPFQVANVVSAALWAAGVIAPSFFFVTFQDVILQYVRDYAPIGLAVLVAMAALNSIPTSAFAFTTLVAFLGAGALLVFAGQPVAYTVAAGAVGAFLGDLMAYRSGAKHGADFRAAWPNGWGKEAGDKARKAFDRNGLVELLYSKFHTTRRSFVPMAAGAREASLAAFLPVSAISALLWAGVLLTPIALAKHYFGW
jgi:membrane protein DedA with SNARE-associated domain